jgi:hypothetical protein
MLIMLQVGNLTAEFKPEGLTEPEADTITENSFSVFCLCQVLENPAFLGWRVYAM